MKANPTKSKRKPRGNRKPASKQMAAITVKQARALKLRMAGESLESIAKALKYADASGAYRAIISALNKTLQEPAEEVRTMELERLDAMLLALQSALRDGDLKAMDRAIRIMERRAKYLGLDVPVGVPLEGDFKVILEWGKNGNGDGKRGN